MLACSLHGQQKQPIYIVAGDTLTNPYVDLSEVVVLPSIKFKSYDDYVAYYRLQRRTIKVYPQVIPRLFNVNGFGPPRSVT